MPRIKIDRHRYKAVKSYLNEHLEVDKIVTYSECLNKDDYFIKVDETTGETLLDDCFHGYTPIKEGDFIAVTYGKEYYQLIPVKNPDGSIKELVRI